MSPVRGIEVDDAIGPEGWQNAPTPIRIFCALVMLECVCRSIGCCQHLDIKTLVQRARAKFWFGQLFGHAVVDGLGVGAGELVVEAENVAQLVANPHAAGRATKEVDVVGEGLPDGAVRSLTLPPPVERGEKIGHRHTLRIQHAHDVVIGDDEQVGGCAKAVVRIGKYARVHVAVRANER